MKDPVRTVLKKDSWHVYASVRYTVVLHEDSQKLSFVFSHLHDSFNQLVSFKEIDL